MKTDWLKWGALVAALVATASAEYELARAVGFNMWVAAAVPAALDLYTVRALRVRREVLAAVAAMIGVNAASHLVTAGLLPVNVPLVVAVAAIAPLVLWRVHSLGSGRDEPEPSPKLGEGSPSEVTTPVTVERVDDDQPRALPEPAPMVTEPVIEVPEVSPLWHDWTPREVTAAVPADTPRQVVTGPDGKRSPSLDDEDLADDHDRANKVTAAVPAQPPREVVTEVVTLTPSELRRRASKLNRELVTSTNRPVTIDRLREEFSLTRREAAELRRQVVTPAGGDRS